MENKGEIKLNTEQVELIDLISNIRKEHCSHLNVYKFAEWEHYFQKLEYVLTERDKDNDFYTQIVITSDGKTNYYKRYLSATDIVDMTECVKKINSLSSDSGEHGESLKRLSILCNKGINITFNIITNKPKHSIEMDWLDLHVNDRMENKDIANEVAKIINESNCIEEAIKFSNSNDENNGAYLAFVAGAYFIVKHLKESDMKEAENNSNTDEAKKAWHEDYNNWIFVGDRQPGDAFMCIVKMFNEFSDTWTTGTGIFDNGNWEVTDSSGESGSVRYWRRCPDFSQVEGHYVGLKEDVAKIYAKNKDFNNLSETQIGELKQPNADNGDIENEISNKTENLQKALEIYRGDLVVLISDATKVMTVVDVVDNLSYDVICIFWSNDQLVQMSFPIYTIVKI